MGKSISYLFALALETVLIYTDEPCYYEMSARLVRADM